MAQSSAPTHIDETLMWMFSVTLYVSGCDPQWINYVTSNNTPYWVSDSANLNGAVSALQQLIVFGYVRPSQPNLPQVVYDIMILYVVQYGAIIPNPVGRRPSWLRPWRIAQDSSARWRTHPRNEFADLFDGIPGNIVHDNNTGGRLDQMTEWHEGNVWGDSHY